MALSLRTSARQSGFQPEIQGLRAVAVLLVVVFHLWPNRLTGGFVGVDVFFVISGYLITQHIYREVERSGTLSLRQFWSRRIRRLLPASLLVLAVGGGATVLLLPTTTWDVTARQIAASALYVQNWVLARDAVDYMAQDHVATLAQHYWSLSVEEQFYVIWPLLVVVLALATRYFLRRRPRAVWLALVVGITAIGALSFVWSVVATARQQSTAYFVTQTRLWEFAVGALIGLGVVRQVRGPLGHVVVGSVGLFGVVAAGISFNEESLFPGWIALLPVLGTAAVIVAGQGVRYGPGWWLSRRPLVFIGDISYSVYLWHWPLIVVVPYLTGVSLRTVDKVLIGAMTIGLAWLTKVWVEDPVRRGTFLRLRPWRSFAFAGAAMAIVVAGSTAMVTELDRRTDELAADAQAAMEGASLSTSSLCFGPAALEAAGECTSVIGTGPPTPAAQVVIAQNRSPTYPGCQAGLSSTGVTTCHIGSTDPHPERVVAIVGDSHATHWFSAFDRLGQERNWRVVTFAKSSCPLTTALRVLPTEQNDDAQQSCRVWAEKVRDQVAADRSISYVFTSAFSSAYEFRDSRDDRLDEPDVDGFRDVWRSWSSAGKDVFVIKDVPPSATDNVPNCVATHSDDILSCAGDRDDIPRDVMAQAARSAADPRVHLIDLTDRFCDDATCYPVVGNVIVYRDSAHLSHEYSQALAPYLGAQVDQLLSGR